MKYLIDYFLYENNYNADWKKPDSQIRNNLVDDIEDILLELVDIGYRKLILGFTSDTESPFIWIKKRGGSINWSEVNPIIQRIERCLNIEGFKVLRKEVINPGSKYGEQLYIFFDKE